MKHKHKQKNKQPKARLKKPQENAIMLWESETLFFKMWYCSFDWSENLWWNIAALIVAPPISIQGNFTIFSYLHFRYKIL